MSHSSENTPSFSIPVRVLVVDDDTTCLSIIDAMLRKWNYEVVAVKHPLDALCILRMNGGLFDLVVLDVHMPEMNGFKLQQLIIEEFDLPVVLMSADNKEAIILKGIEGGAVYFISKPIDPDDLRDLWQFAAMNKKYKGGVGKVEYENHKGKTTNVVVEDKCYREGDDESSGTEYRPKRKYTNNGNIDDNNGDNNTILCTTQKKQKVVWSAELHNKFLEAVNNIGLERAVPRKILEEMNVPGLTRENVASHLQKYRIFLKRLVDLNNMDDIGEKSLSNRLFRSSLTSKNPGVTLDKLTEQKMRMFYSGEYEAYASVLDSSNHGGISFPILETSSLKSNHQGINSMQMYQQPPIQVRSNISSGFESNYGLMKIGVGGSDFVPRETTSSNSNLVLQNYGSFSDNNYVNDHTNELGRTRFIDTSNGYIMNKGLVNIDAIDQNNKLKSTAPTDPCKGGHTHTHSHTNFDASFGLTNDTTSISPLLPPHDCTTPINTAFTSQLPTTSSTQEQNRDEDADFCSSFDLFHIRDINVTMDEQNSTKQQQGAESMIMTSNPSCGMNESRAYFQWIEQNLINQYDDEAFLESVFSTSPYDQANISFGGQFRARRTSDQI